jgi:hypothetical protein
MSSLASATFGGIAIARWLEDHASGRGKTAVTAGLVSLATLLPLGIPGLGAKLSWLIMPYPRLVDWAEARQIAGVIRRSGLEERLINGDETSALAIWSDARLEEGHWVEVQPPLHPAIQISVTDRVYLVPVAPGDESLLKLRKEGWIIIHGGSDWTSVVTFTIPPPLDTALHVRNSTWARAASEIASHCEHNALGNWVTLFMDPNEIPRRRALRGWCSSRVGTMEIALLLWAYALEKEDPQQARRVHDCARDLRTLSAIVGNERSLNFGDAAWHEEMKRNMVMLAREAGEGSRDLTSAFYKVLDHVHQGRGGQLFKIKLRRPARSLCGRENHRQEPATPLHIERMHNDTHGPSRPKP